MRFIVSAFCVVLLSVSLEAVYQNVTVSGIAVCNGQRMKNVQVELYEYDVIDSNDLLSTVHTNSEGEFILTGGENEFGSIDPFVRFTHTCNVREGCHRQSDYYVPHSAINSFYNMTYVILDIIVADEKQKCN